MYPFIVELLCCIAPYQEIPEPVLHNLFPNESSSSAVIRQAEFDQVYAHYAPRIIKELGVEIEELCWQRPFDSRAQFVNRYINVLVKRLAVVPPSERDTELDTLKLVIPANKHEYDYIRGDKNPLPIKIMGKQECWPLRNQEIRERINAIRDRVKAEKANHS
jgi:hypothetical protein